MSVAAEKKLLTAEEFYELSTRPENRNKWLELVGGEVIELPGPTRPHGAVAAMIIAHLVFYAMAHRRFYVTGNDSGVILARGPDTVRGPDVAVYDDATRFRDLHPKYGEVVPLLAVEVISPSDRPGQVARKVKEYLDAGVNIVWAVYPDEYTIIIHRRGQEPAICGFADDITGEEVLPDFRCPLARIFALPGEAAASA